VGAVRSLSIMYSGLNMPQTVDSVLHCRTKHIQMYSHMLKIFSANLHD
jgi:hypothetical protein